MKENPQDYTVYHESKPDDPLEDLKGIERVYEDLEMVPSHLQSPKMINPKANLRISKANNLRIKKLRKLQRYARQDK